MHSGPQPVHVCQENFGFGVQSPARSGECDTATCAVQQIRVEFAFEDLDLLRQRRLGNSATFSGSAEMEFLCDSEKVVDQPKQAGDMHLRADMCVNMSGITLDRRDVV